MDWQRQWQRLRRPSVWLAAGMVAFVATGAAVGLGHGGTKTGTLRTATGSSGLGLPAVPAAPSPAGVSGSPLRATAETKGVLGGEAGAGGRSAGVAGDTQAAQAGPSSAAPSALPAGLGQARVVRTAQLQVEVRRGTFQRGFDGLSAIAATNGGFVASSSTANGDGSAASTGELDLRVPADHFDATLRAVRELGRTRQEHLQGEDVSGQLVDLEARIKSLQTEEDTLRTIVGQAKTVGELLQVQPQLFDVRQQIEQLQAQKAHLDDAASMSTVHVSMFEPGAIPTKPPQPEPATGLAHSLSRAVHGAGAVAGGMVIVAGYLVPFFVLALVGWGAWHVRRRRVAPRTAEA